MKILAIAKVDPRTTPEKLRPNLEAEVRCAWKLYQEGAVREMYSRQDRPMGVVFILESSTVDDARKLVDELPFVRDQLIDFDLIPLGPFSHFELLFRDRAAEPEPLRGGG